MNKQFKLYYMSDIKEHKKEEYQLMLDFIDLLNDYGHIFHEDPQVLDEPFNKILTGIDQIKKIMDKNYST